MLEKDYYNTIIGLCYDITTWYEIVAPMLEHDDTAPYAVKILDDLGGEICICPQRLEPDERYIVQSCDVCAKKASCYIAIAPPCCSKFERE